MYTGNWCMYEYEYWCMYEYWCIYEYEYWCMYEYEYWYNPCTRTLEQTLTHVINTKFYTVNRAG